jgi:hypothetical protein
MFELFLEQLRGLGKINGPSFVKHFYLLESLATVRTFALCAFMNAFDTIAEAFKLFFDIIRFFPMRLRFYTAAHGG